MAQKILDALGLAILDEHALIPRLAAIWCRDFKGRAPHSKSEMIRWIKRDYGPLIEPKQRDRIAMRLITEAKQQLRLRSRRKKLAVSNDVLLTEAGSDARVGRLLRDRLGPANVWVRRQTIASRARSPRTGLSGSLTQNAQPWNKEEHCCYISSGFYSGLVAGLIPIQMSLRRIINPCLLVYRKGFGQPRSYWVPGHITTVADAFIWVIPEEAQEFLKLEGTRVEHDGEAQALRLHTRFGSKTLPWRTL
jgi:hypothetical protein